MQTVEQRAPTMIDFRARPLSASTPRCGTFVRNALDIPVLRANLHS